MTSIKYQWVETLPLLVFIPGAHGNFLARCLSIAAGIEPDFDFYKDSNGGVRQGAHAEYEFPIVNHTHTPERMMNKHPEIFCYINFTPQDHFTLVWHSYLAAAELNLDVLEVDSFEYIHKFIEKKQASPIHGLKYLIENYNNKGTSGLRELFKKRLTIDNHKVAQQNRIKSEFKILNTFEFSWFYNKKLFCRHLKSLLVKLGYDYKVDVTHHIEEFIQKKQDIIQANAIVNRAFNSYRIKEDMDISTLSVYEQAYLDSLIEQHLGYEIELCEEYPTNTKDLNPVQAWEGKRYDL